MPRCSCLSCSCIFVCFFSLAPSRPSTPRNEMRTMITAAGRQRTPFRSEPSLPKTKHDHHHHHYHTKLVVHASRPQVAESESTPQRALSRRDQLALFLFASVPISTAATATVAAAQEPQIGDCTDCLGEVNSSLNTCTLSSQSCISTLNDDEAHFAAPWQYDGLTADAVNRLIEVATGGKYDPGFINAPGGVSRVDAALFIVKGVAAVVTNDPANYPKRPQRTRRSEAEYVPFDGEVVDRKTTENGSEYLRITLGLSKQNEDPTQVIDCEFLFFPNDNLVDVRASSRVDPPSGGLQGGELALSFTSGVVVDRNVARRQVDALRNALRWENAPVLTDFDPKFNPEAPLWLEKIFKPLDVDRNNFVPSGIPYPSSGGGGGGD